MIALRRQEDRMSIGLTGKDDGTTAPTGKDGVGVLGTSSAGTGVRGEGNAFGVQGVTAGGVGVFGGSEQLPVLGVTFDIIGVRGLCFVGTAVRGDRPFVPTVGVPPSGSVACFGFLAGDDPVFNQRAGVYGESDQQGVMGMGGTSSSTGVYGSCRGGGGYGVRGETHSGIAVHGQCLGDGWAGAFKGNVQVTGNVEVTGDLTLSGADCAENFRAFAEGSD
jgi:hypothetical protein